jgi:glutaredoxin
VTKTLSRYHSSMAEPARCASHGVVLTPAGDCVLCVRRASEGSRGSGLRVVASVVGALLVALVGYRAYATLTDPGVTKVRPEPAAVMPTATATATATATTAATAMAPTATAGVPASREQGSTSADDHERRVLEAQRSVRVDLYGAGWCPSCRKAREWLDTHGVAYTYRDTSDAVNKHTMRALNPQSTIPTIDIDGRVLVGFDGAQMRAAIRSAAAARVANHTR